MSYKVAQNLGVYKIKGLSDALNRGYSLEHIATILHVSVSRASRIVNALFERRYTPRPCTEEYIKKESESMAHEAKDFEKQLEEMKVTNILPFETNRKKNRA